ncbi:MarR family winged helix-turn-helix transcriptional regulator [Rathayibacter sp. KR2-224]|uniref:MarR family winged helix-turn-helix transcriptional regulator n=1 Tax=Rathayibacter sp. KR2-224 TaxID=3400913 RepID=UPI003BFD9E11
MTSQTPIAAPAVASARRERASRASAAPTTIAGPPAETKAEPPSRRIVTHELSSDLRVAVARLSRRLRAEKADGDLADGLFSVLALLFREGPKTLGELSDHERVTPPSMNRTVNKLEAAGYVVRQASADDRRKVLFVPTDAGRELVKETRRRRDAWLDRRLAKLPPQTRALLADAAAVIRELADS